MPIPQLTPFPDPPRIYQPEEEFDAKADEMAGHLPVLVSEINAMVAGSNAAWADIDTKTSAATNAASTASSAAGAAGTSASNAEAAKQSAAASANSAGSSASAALSSKNEAVASAAAAAVNAVYAKNKIDHLISRSAMTPSNDATQLQRAMMNNSPIIRLTRNQALLGASGASPTGWYAHPNCVFTNICNIGTEGNPSNRHPIAQELLAFLGLANIVNFGLGFNIWRVTWPAGTNILLYQFVNTSNYLSTTAAYTKLESGAVAGAWADGATNAWKLTGQQAGGNMPHTYWMIHPQPTAGAAGSLLFALPAAVIGPVDLSNQQNWALYPYIGDQQHD